MTRFASSRHRVIWLIWARSAHLGRPDRPPSALRSTATKCRRSPAVGHSFQLVAYLSSPADWSSSGAIATR